MLGGLGLVALVVAQLFCRNPFPLLSLEQSSHPIHMRSKRGEQKDPDAYIYKYWA